MEQVDQQESRKWLGNCVVANGCVKLLTWSHSVDLTLATPQSHCALGVHTDLPSAETAHKQQKTTRIFVVSLASSGKRNNTGKITQIPGLAAAGSARRGGRQRTETATSRSPPLDRALRAVKKTATSVAPAQTSAFASLHGYW